MKAAGLPPYRGPSPALGAHAPQYLRSGCKPRKLLDWKPNPAFSAAVWWLVEPVNGRVSLVHSTDSCGILAARRCTSGNDTKMTQLGIECTYQTIPRMTLALSPVEWRSAFSTHPSGPLTHPRIAASLCVSWGCVSWGWRKLGLETNLISALELSLKRGLLRAWTLSHNLGCFADEPDCTVMKSLVSSSTGTSPSPIP
jgi:hypothetical protein